MNDARVLPIIDLDDHDSEPCQPGTILTPIAREDAERAARGLKALSDATRLQLLSMIASAPGGQACVCDLTAPLGLTQPTVSHHLKIMADAGLITRDKRGAWAWYAIDPRKLPIIQGLLD